MESTVGTRWLTAMAALMMVISTACAAGTGASAEEAAMAASTGESGAGENPARSSRVTTTSPAMWWWLEEAGVGAVERAGTKVTGSLTTDVGDLEDRAMTLWLVVFNDPSACTTGPAAQTPPQEGPRCTDGDIFAGNPAEGDVRLNEAVGADFLYLDGAVTDGGTERWKGKVAVNGDDPVTGSGLAELLCAFHTAANEACDIDDIETPGLVDAFEAELHLVLHDHGPAATGPLRRQQLSSFLGGCDLFPAPFPTGPDDLQDCQSIQFSVHVA